MTEDFTAEKAQAAAWFRDLRDQIVAGFEALEDQCCLIGPDGYIGEGSPDRVDALVWALTELMLKPQPSAKTGHVRGLY